MDGTDGLLSPVEYSRSNHLYLTRWEAIGLLSSTPDVNKFVLSYALEVCLQYLSNHKNPAFNDSESLRVAIFPIIVRLFNSNKLPQHIFVQNCEQLNYDASINAYLKNEDKHDIPYTIESGIKSFIPVLIDDVKKYVLAAKNSSTFNELSIYGLNDIEAELISSYCDSFDADHLKF